MRKFSFVLFMFASLFSEREMTIHVASSARRECPTVYLAKMRPYESEIARNLDTVLRQGCNTSFEITLLEVEENKQFLAFSALQSKGFDATMWQKLGVDFVIVPVLEQNGVTLHVLDVYTARTAALQQHGIAVSRGMQCAQMNNLVDRLFQEVLKKQCIVAKKILFARQIEDPKLSEDKWKSEIWQMDYDGQNQEQVTFENSYSITPSLIYDKKNSPNYHFLYVCYKQGQPRIYIASKKEGRGSELIALQGNQLLPEMSRDHGVIAFISDALGRSDLYLQRLGPNGPTDKAVQAYSFPKATIASPTLSPDATKVAFVTDQFGTLRICLIDAELALSSRKRQTPQVLTRTHTENTAPHFSPDGTKLAYSAKVSGMRQIFVYDFRTKEELQVTFGLGNKENPKWASDNMHIVYNSTSPTYDIFLTDIVRKEPVRLTQNSGKCHYPSMQQ